MPRYVAFLRGVSPQNAKMPDLKRAFEAAGFTAVKTVLSSGNVIFDAPRATEGALARNAEAAMAQHLGRTFSTIVRPATQLRDLIAADPFAAFALPAEAKRVVTFLEVPHDPALVLPGETNGVRFLAGTGREVFIAYVPHPRGPVFMTLIQKVFGSTVTTRTWNTVRKCANA